MSGLFDDLARTMASPMPRRRALRLLGGALVAAALPGVVRPTAARSYPASGKLTTACNPNCSGEYPVKCVCPAEGGCYIGGCGAPGSICCCFEESNAGTPGAAVCPPGSTCGGGKGKPNCRAPKICGPDVTAGLGDAVSRTENAFAGWSSTKRHLACSTLVGSPLGAVGWEVNQLGPGGRDKGAENFRPECATCTSNSLSVQVGSGCHYAGSVNYVIYGVMLRLCHQHYKSSSDYWADAPFYSKSAMDTYITAWKTLRGAPNLTASLGWAKAGYDGWPNGPAPTPAPELPSCRPCPKRVTSRLTVRWLPFGTEL